MGSKVSSQSSNTNSQQQSTTTTTTTSSSSTTTSSSSSSTTSSAYTGLGNIIKLLPSGTVFLFHFLNPLLTNNGQCHTYNKYLSAILIIVCGLSCCVTSFTDSYKGSDGSTHYGVVTAKGIWPSSSSSNSLSGYKLRFSDFVHAFLSVIIFAVLALLDTNTVRCFYPSFETTEKTLIMVLPTVIGSISSTVFTLFPSTRNGVGYPSSDASTTSGTSTTSESNTEKV
ncbi:protein DMP2-like isoform X2 [Rhodamnia argentea]|uniref:Protein DMP2-like isoform X2 n=1 Tax=Rhodamnia argentea TaxID=178133 RepID=A0ABM3HHU2_9MYRT|nr:protein DMP2-like isoform X2 [Rhodamnia argentea]